MKKGPLPPFRGKMTYDGILSELLSEKNHEMRTMNETSENPYTVTMLSIIYSCLSEKTVKELVPILGFRVLNQDKAYLEAKKLIIKSSTQDKWLLDLLFLLLEECPTTVSLYKIEVDLFPPLIIKLINTFLLLQMRLESDPN